MYAFIFFRLHSNSSTAYSMDWRYSSMAMALPREVSYCTAPLPAFISLPYLSPHSAQFPSLSALALFDLMLYETKLSYANIYCVYLILSYLIALYFFSIEYLITDYTFISDIADGVIRSIDRPLGYQVCTTPLLLLYYLYCSVT